MGHATIEHEKFGTVCACGCHVYGTGERHSIGCCEFTYRQYLHPSGELDEEVFKGLCAKTGLTPVVWQTLSSPPPFPASGVLPLVKIPLRHRVWSFLLLLFGGKKALGGELLRCECQRCGVEVTVRRGGTGRCECGNHYSWERNILWWNEGGTGVRFDKKGNVTGTGGWG